MYYILKSFDYDLFSKLLIKVCKAFNLTITRMFNSLMTNPLQSYMYTSKLTDISNVACVTEIIKKSRINNERLNLKGLMLFDGVNFCQYIEGPPENIEHISEKICADSRHTDIVLHYKNETPADTAPYKNWSIGFVTLDNHINSLFKNVTGLKSMKILNNLMPKLDIN